MTIDEYRALIAPRKRGNKYRAVKTTVDGVTFDSKREAARWQELELLQEAGEISDLRRQVAFPLLPAENGERGVKYIADFVYTRNGLSICEDVKSAATRNRQDYIIKRKLFKHIYGKQWEFLEVT